MKKRKRHSDVGISSGKRSHHLSGNFYSRKIVKCEPDSLESCLILAKGEKKHVLVSIFYSNCNENMYRSKTVGVC